MRSAAFVFGAVAIGLVGSAILGSLAVGTTCWAIAVILAIVSLVASDPTHVPVNLRLYQLHFAIVVVVAAAGLVGASRWRFVDALGAIGPSFIVLASAFVVVGALAWRSLVHPSARTAARVGLAAVLLPVAMLADLWAAASRAESSSWSKSGPLLAVIMAFLLLLLGVFASATAIRGCRPAEELPEARARGGG